MKNIFLAVEDALRKNVDTVLVTILSKSGSAPRGAGAKMLVYKDGKSLDTIGGGAVEYKSIELAMVAIQNKKSFIHKFRLAPNEAADIGMVCGGDVCLYFQYIEGDQEHRLKEFEAINAAFQKDERVWLVTEIQEDDTWRMGLHSESRENIKGSGFSFERTSQLIERDHKKYFVDQIISKSKVFLFGGGHISQKLVPILHSVQFNCIVLEDRAEFGLESLFPEAEKVVISDFIGFDQHISLSKDDYVVILTRGHKHDYDVLKKVLKTEVCYIGLIGSRTKLEKTKNQLLEDGFSQEDFNRVYAPIGTRINAVTPEEIAVSIAGELIMVRGAIL